MRQGVRGRRLRKRQGLIRQGLIAGRALCEHLLELGVLRLELADELVRGALLHRVRVRVGVRARVRVGFQLASRKAEKRAPR